MARPALINITNLSPRLRAILNGAVIILSVLCCVLILPARLPGMELLGITPNWLLMWVVAWSFRRTYLQGAIAGLVLGLIQDAMTGPYPTHVLSLVTVGVLTVYIQKQRWLNEDLLWISVLVFVMTLIAETITACQYLIEGIYPNWQGLIIGNISAIWNTHQKVALYSAILSSLWMPVLYYPLNLWWHKLYKLQKSL